MLHTQFHTDETNETTITSIKTAKTELKNAWESLQAVVLTLPPSESKRHLLAHIETLMDWRSLQDLKRMQQTLALMKAIAHQETVIEAVQDGIEIVRETLSSVLSVIQEAEWG